MQLDKYLAELNKIKLLEYAEEQSLWQAYKENGDGDARRKLIESYQPLVFKVAGPFRDLPNIMDVLQEGTVGLIESAEAFDYTRGVAFSLFATHRIRGRMYNFLKKEGKADLACLGEDAEHRLSNMELIADTGMPIPEVVELQEATGQLQSAMERLPEKEQLVLDQIYMKCREVSEVAEQMHVSTSYIYRLHKSGVRRARGMLSRFMHNWK